MTKKSPFDIAYDKLNNTEGEKGRDRFKYLKMTQHTYYSCLVILVELRVYGKSSTFIKRCAEFFKQCGFTVTETEDGVGYDITYIKEN